MKRLNIFGIALLGALTAAAQTTPPAAPNTCTTAPTSIKALNLERNLNVSSGLFTTLTPNIPANVLAAIASGALEVREQTNYDVQNNVVNVQAFTTQPGSPSPTPSNTIQTGNVLWGFRIQVENTYFSCQPVPSVLVVGRILSNYPNTPFGNANNALVAIGFGYTTDNPPKVNNVTMLVPGVAGLYTPAAVGTLTFPTSTVNPPGTTDNNPVIVFRPGQTQATASKQIFLDASQSKDPNNLQLTYAWRQVNTNLPASISNGSTATPLVTFGPKGDYTFEVTVTNSQGGKSTAQTTVTYYGQ